MSDKRDPKRLASKSERKAAKAYREYRKSRGNRYFQPSEE